MLTKTTPLLQGAGALSLIFLSIFSALTTVHSDAVVQDPMQAQANSFGWLAIRNFTYCLSSSPDPPDKPRGVQPSKRTFADEKPSKQLTGIGDSVVVLYHPENTNKAIAWCNTLVAFQSTEHVKCHIALPTCQRCDAVRDVTKAAAVPVVGGPKAGRENKAPSGKVGTAAGIQQARPPSDDDLVPLRRRDGRTYDPDDPLVKDPDAIDPNAKQPTTPPPQSETPSRPQVRLHSSDSSAIVDEDATNDLSWKQPSPSSKTFAKTSSRLRFERIARYTSYRAGRTSLLSICIVSACRYETWTGIRFTLLVMSMPGRRVRVLLMNDLMLEQEEAASKATKRGRQVMMQQPMLKLERFSRSLAMATVERVLLTVS